MPDKLDSHDIKDLRKRAGLTQKELAAKCKVDAITVSRWELGKQRPQANAIRHLQRLHRKLDGNK